MTNKLTKFGGTDWAAGNILTATDIVETMGYGTIVLLGSNTAGSSANYNPSSPGQIFSLSVGANKVKNFIVCVANQNISTISQSDGDTTQPYYYFQCAGSNSNVGTIEGDSSPSSFTDNGHTFIHIYQPKSGEKTAGFTVNYYVYSGSSGTSPAAISSITNGYNNIHVFGV